MFHYNRYGMKKRRFFFLFIPLIIAALAGIVMLLWNAILPDVVHVEKLQYWQALGLLILCKILFGFGFGRRGGRPFYGPPPHIRQKWMNMNDEERLKFKEEWRRRCGERK